MDEYGDDKTVLSPRIRVPKAPHLRFVGVGDFPPIIVIRPTSGSTFTIGRHDANLGMQQSDYEFPQKTRAVSHQHAYIQWDDTQYYL